MKIYIVGGGPKVAEICDALPSRKLDLFVISSDVRALQDVIHKRAVHTCTDPATFDFATLEAPPTDQDLIVVVEPEEERLRALLDHLTRSGTPGSIIAFTSAREKKLVREYGRIFFKSDQEIFRKELRELIRANATMRKVNDLRDLARQKPALLVLIWGNPDPDAIGAAYALRELLSQDVKECTIAYTGEFTRSENRAMARVLKIPTAKFRPDMVTPETTVATVDAQPSFFQMDESVHFDVVIDHHPPAAMDSPRFVDIRPKYGAASSILAEYFLHTRRTIPRRVATALFFGLKIDTGNLTRNVCDADVEAFGHLRTLANDDWMRLIELSQLPMAVLDHLAYAITHKKMARDVAFSYLGTIDNPDTCVPIADLLVKVSEIAWTVVACRSGEKVVVIFRTDGYRKHAGKVAESLFLPYGTAGGHRTMARAELQTEKIEAEIGRLTNQKLEEWLLRKIGERLRPIARLAPKVGRT